MGLLGQGTPATTIPFPTPGHPAALGLATNSTAKGRGPDSLPLPKDHWFPELRTVPCCPTPARTPVGPEPPRGPKSPPRDSRASWPRGRPKFQPRRQAASLDHRAAPTWRGEGTLSVGAWSWCGAEGSPGRGAGLGWGRARIPTLQGLRMRAAGRDRQPRPAVFGLCPRLGGGGATADSPMGLPATRGSPLRGRWGR